MTSLAAFVRGAAIIDGDNVAFADALRALLHRASEDESLPMDEIEASLLERELFKSTALGDGVAVPHCYNASVTSSMCWVGVAPGGVVVQTPDDKSVRLLFLLISPVGGRETHLLALAAIARVVSNPITRERLLSQTSADGVTALMHEL